MWAVIALLDYGPEAMRLGARVPLGVNMAIRREAIERVGGFDTRIGRKAGYGLRMYSGSNYMFTKAPDDKGWFLWAGFCFFNFRDVEGRSLDFRGNMPRGLDTGGGNWDPIYSRRSSEDFELAMEDKLPLHLGQVDAKYQILDGAMLHVGGASYIGPSRSLDYRRLLADHIWSAYLGGISNRLIEV